ncbi:MAG TPA: lipopolysaccharide transport periplasmic protein LptA [Candidatus Methylomirabilis sp.]|nr:lipopolysaccharide transport periplasmic protein LptA [Candidatus Methylomirabilis sp.]
MRGLVSLLGVLVLLGAISGGLRAAEERAPITISADSLEVSRKARVATYQGNVVANDRGRGMSLLADRIDFFFDERMEEVERATAVGNVRLSYGARRGAAERADYFPREERAVLSGHPKVWQESDVVTGCRITLLLREDRSRVEACDGERVNAVLYPKREASPPR